jgi:hypothetical protein
MTLLQRAKYSVHLQGIIVREVLSKVLRAIRTKSDAELDAYEKNVKRAIVRASKDMFCSRRSKNGRQTGIQSAFIYEALLGVNTGNKNAPLGLKTGAYDKVFFAFAQKQVGIVDLAALVYHKEMTRTRPWVVLKDTLLSKTGRTPVPNKDYSVRFISGHGHAKLNDYLADGRVAEIEIVCRNGEEFAKGAAKTLMAYVLAKLAMYKKKGGRRFKAVVVSLVSRITNKDASEASKTNDFGQKLAYNRGTTPLKKITESFGFKQVSVNLYPVGGRDQSTPYILQGIAFATLMDSDTETWEKKLERSMAFQGGSKNKNDSALHNMCQVKPKQGRSYCV